MNKQLMSEIVQFVTIMLVAIIISGFNPSFLMLVCMQLSACTSLALINHEQYSWMYGVAAMLIIINPSVLTFVPFILVNIALFYCSIKATLFIASFLYDMKVGNEQLQPKPDADDSSNIKVTERKDENIIGTLEKKTTCACCICFDDKNDFLVAGSDIEIEDEREKNRAEKKTTLYDAKIKIFDNNTVCTTCFSKNISAGRTTNPMTNLEETTWHLFKDGNYVTTKEVEPKAITTGAQYQSPVAASSLDSDIAQNLRSQSIIADTSFYINSQHNASRSASPELLPFLNQGYSSSNLDLRAPPPFPFLNLGCSSSNLDLRASPEMIRMLHIVNEINPSSEIHGTFNSILFSRTPL